MMIKVVPAFYLLGSIKAKNPSDKASTPVTADVPLENARKIRKNVIGCNIDASISGGSTTNPRSPVK